MTTDVQKAIEVSRNVALSEITLREARIETGFEPMADVSEMQLAPKYRAAYQIRPEDPDRLFVTVDFEVSASSEQPSGSAGLMATFMAIYQLKDAASYDPVSLEHFASINGVYNLWPYWRELVHTAFNRIGLGSVVLPVFRIQAKKLPEEEPEEEDEAAATGSEAPADED